MDINQDYLKSYSWDKKARVNPLYAVMSDKVFMDAPADNFSQEQLDLFFAKGERIFSYALNPILTRLSPDKNNFRILEYGCGMGRILKSIYSNGFCCAGIDISETMLKWCYKLVPEVKELYLLQPNKKSEYPSRSADLVFSYAVLQHIDRLTDYVAAIKEMDRCLKPGGILLIQANCADFEEKFPISQLPRTVNFDKFSIHLSTKINAPIKIHYQDNWSGVYIGVRKMSNILTERNISLIGAYSDLFKRRSVWFLAIKSKNEPPYKKGRR